MTSIPARFLPHAALLVTILTPALVARSALADAAPTTAPATAAAAVAAFTKALANGDTATLAAVTTGGNESDREWARAYAGQAGALRSLKGALARRFGAGYAETDAGRMVVGRINEVDDAELRTDLRRAKAGPEKDDAVVLTVDESTPADRQPRVVRVGGAWRVDLGSLAEYIFPNDVPVMKSVAATATGLAADVAAGKFATLDDAADAIDDRLSDAETPARPALAAPAKP